MGEIISATKIFADMGQVAGGVSVGGAVWLQRISKFADSDARKTEGKKAIGVDGFAGVQETTGGGTITMTEYRQDKPQVDWRKVKKDKKYFMIMTQDENSGLREKFLRCRVSKVDRSADDEGQHTDEIEIIYGSKV